MQPNYSTTGSSRRVMADINVTPMVDIMLVLLIIFMVTAPMLQQGVQVELPHTKSAPLPTTRQEKLRVSIDAKQQIFLGESPVSRSELKNKLQGNLKLQVDKQVYLFADRKLTYGLVVDVMSVLKEAGAENIAMVTDSALE